MSIFITGTDTGIGKTTAALLLMQALKRRGYRVAAMKPISCGCEKTRSGLRHEDALALMAESSVILPYELVNPYVFKEAIAPHIAAQQINVQIDVAEIKHCYQQIKSQVDVVIVEGAGGWLVPINDTQSTADMAAYCNWDVILVVEIRLGCLNHALLSAVSIQEKKCRLTGWIANSRNAEMPYRAENIKSLRSRLAAPLLAELPELSEAINGERYYQLDNYKIDT